MFYVNILPQVELIYHRRTEMAMTIRIFDFVDWRVLCVWRDSPKVVRVEWVSMSDLCLINAS